MAVALKVHAVEVPALAVDPLAALEAVARGTTGDYALLHSGSAAGFSVLGWEPLARNLIDADRRCGISVGEKIVNTAPTTRAPLTVLEELLALMSFSPPHPLVGWLGCISYDIGRYIERIPETAVDDLRWPLACFSLFRHYLVFDRAAGRTYGYEISDKEVGEGFVVPLPKEASGGDAFAPGELLSAPSREKFEEAVRRVKEYIAAGDIYQANVSQRWPVRTGVAPHQLFRRLCEFSPAAYSACMRINDAAAPGGVRHVLSASPELFLAVEDGRAVTRPIKGTRPRDLADAGRDAALREALADSAKDAAELTMIVDLLRNDLGRVSKFGTVRVTEPRVIEQHPTVWHTVATVASELREDAGLAEVLAALCPGGSITGAPKIRAMQIIEELEAQRRGLYCGNIGVIGPPGGAGVCPNLALNVAIRTIQMNGEMAYVHAGAGIVADSDPVQEYQETLHKAAAMLRALGK